MTLKIGSTQPRTPSNATSPSAPAPAERPDSFTRGAQSLSDRAPGFMAKTGELGAKAGLLQASSDPAALLTKLVEAKDRTGSVRVSDVLGGDKEGPVEALVSDPTVTTRGHLNEEDGWNAAKPALPQSDAAREAANRAALEAELFLGHDDATNPGDGLPAAPRGDWSDLGDAAAGIGGGFALGATATGTTPFGASFAAGATIGWLANRGLNAAIGRGDGSIGAVVGDWVHGKERGGKVEDDPAVKQRSTDAVRSLLYHSGVAQPAQVGSGNGRSNKPRWTEDLGTGRGSAAGGTGGTNADSPGTGKGTGDGGGTKPGAHELDPSNGSAGNRFRRVFAGTHYENRMNPVLPYEKQSDARKERHVADQDPVGTGAAGGAVISGLGLKAPDDDQAAHRRPADASLRDRSRQYVSRPVAPDVGGGNTPRPRKG
jgi:hypothetical protein